MDINPQPAPTTSLNIEKNGSGYNRSFILSMALLIIIVATLFYQKLFRKNNSTSRLLNNLSESKLAIAINQHNPIIKKRIQNNLKGEIKKLLNQICGNKSGLLLEQYLLAKNVSWNQIQELEAVSVKVNHKQKDSVSLAEKEKLSLLLSTLSNNALS